MPKIGDIYINDEGLSLGVFFHFDNNGKGYCFVPISRPHYYFPTTPYYSASDISNYWGNLNHYSDNPLRHVTTAEYDLIHYYYETYVPYEIKYEYIQGQDWLTTAKLTISTEDSNFRILTVEDGVPYLYNYKNGLKSEYPSIDGNIADNTLRSFPIFEVQLNPLLIQDSEGDNSEYVFGGTLDGNNLWQTTIEFGKEPLKVQTPSVEEKEYIMHLHEGWDIYSFPFDITTLSIVEHLTKEADGSFTVNNLSSGFNVTSVTENGETYDSFSLSESVLGYAASNDDIVTVKDYNGRVFIPEYNFDGIGGISKYQGYQIKVAANRNVYLRLTAKPHYREIGSNNEVDFYIEYEIPEGWYLLAWPWEESADPEYVFADHINNINIIKDGNGKAFMPEYNFNGIGKLNAYKGYYIKSKKEFTLKIQRPT